MDYVYNDQMGDMMYVKNVCVLVSLLMISVSFAHAMEKRTRSLESLFSLVRSCFVSQESSTMQLIRTDKNNFEQKLLMPKVARKKYPDQVPIAWTYFPRNKDIEFWYFKLLLDPFFEKIKDDPSVFLYYCYYQKHHKDRELDLLEFVVFSTDLLNKCLHMCIDGYSALGAAMLAKDITDDNRRDFIRQLIDFGFTCTQKDKVLAELLLYDSISVKHKKTMILLLCDDHRSDFSILPYDVKKYLIYWILRPYYDVSLVPLFK